MKIAPFKKDIRKTEAHRHNSYFEIIYLSKGGGTHTIDNQIHQVLPPMLFFVRKEQVHHWDLDSEPEGYVAILKKELLEKSMDGELRKLFAKLSNVSSLQVKDTATIEQLFRLLETENTGNSDSRFTILEGLLKALLAKMLEVAKPISYKSYGNSDLHQSFRELLGQSSEIKNKVAHYAALLNTTPQNLNAVCRKAVNQSAAEVLSEYIIHEAKRLLIYTDNTVAQIAFSLEFTDPSHFVKYFKRHTGHTPSAFRAI